MQDLLPLVFLGAVILGFYLLIVKPAQRRQREAAAVIARLSAGQEVMTTAGIFGTLRAVDDDTVLIEVCPGTTIKYAKVAIARIVGESDGPGLASPATGTRPEDDRESNA